MSVALADHDGRIRSLADSSIIEGIRPMHHFQLEQLIRNIDARTTRIEQFLRALAPKEALREEVGTLATKQELREEVTKLATKDE